MWSCHGGRGAGDDSAPLTISVGCIAQSLKIRILRELLDYEFVRRWLVGYKLLVLFLAAPLLTREIDETRK